MILKKTQSGYIAVTSVLIISLVLISVLLSLSLTCFYFSQSILETELKVQSRNAAMGCVSLARAKLGANNNYSSINLQIYLGSIGNCSIISILPQNGYPKSISAQGRYPPNQNIQAVTNLLVTVDSLNSITSIVEN